MATKTANAEGYANGAAITTANTGSGSAIDGFTLNAGTIKATTTSPLKGLVSYNIVADPAAITSMYWLPTASHNLVFRAYFRLTGFPAAAMQLVRLTTASGGTALFSVGLKPTGAIFMLDSTGATLATTTDAQGWNLGQDYRLEFKITQGTNATDSATIQSFAGDGTTPLAGHNLTTTTGAFGTVNVARVAVGKCTAGGGAWNGCLVDDIAIADNTTTMFGPSVAATVLPVASYTSLRVVEVDATASVGTTTLVQATGPASTITNTAPGKWRVIVPELRTEDITLTLTATQGGAIDKDTVTITANNLTTVGGVGPKTFVNGVYV